MGRIFCAIDLKDSGSTALVGYILRSPLRRGDR